MRMPHVVICGSPRSTIFFNHLTHKWIDFREGLLNTNFKKSCSRYHQIYVVVFMLSTRYSCQILMKLEFSGTVLQNKIFKCQISWKSVQWEQCCSRQTYRHDEANGRSSQFCERALKLHCEALHFRNVTSSRMACAFFRYFLVQGGKFFNAVTAVSEASLGLRRNVVLFNHLKPNRRPPFINTQSVPRSKHFSSGL